MSATVVLGAGQAGLTLTATLYDSANASAAGLTTSTLVETVAASGTYLWTGTVPDNHRGYIRFDSAGTFKAAVSINSSEVEFPDVKTSTRSSHTAADIWAVGSRTLTSFGTLVADTATAVWAAGTRTLTSFGTLVADVTTAVWAAGTRTLTSFGTLVADIWANATRTLTSFGTLVADTATAVWAAGTRTLTSGAAPSAAVVAAAVWDEVRSAHLTAGTFGSASPALKDGLAQGGTLTTITLDAGAVALDDYYNNNILAIVSGTGAGQGNIIDSYVGATRIATMAAAWVTAPNSTSRFVILPLGTIPGAVAPSAAAIWSYATRTLTQAIAAVTPPPIVTGDEISLLRGETEIIPFTGLGDISARTKLWFTIKGNQNRPDTGALVQIEETAGLLTLNGAAGIAGQGSITVTNAVTGALTVELDEAAAILLPISDRYYYDIQMLSPAGVRTLTSGELSVRADTTRSIT